MKVVLIIFYTFLCSTVLSNYDINKLYEGKIYGCEQLPSNNILFFGDNGLQIYDGNVLTNISANSDLRFNTIWGVDIDSKERCWIKSYGKNIFFIENDSLIKIECDYGYVMNCELGNGNILFYNFINNDRKELTDNFKLINHTRVEGELMRYSNDDILVKNTLFKVERGTDGLIQYTEKGEKYSGDSLFYKLLRDPDFRLLPVSSSGRVNGIGFQSKDEFFVFLKGKRSRAIESRFYCGQFNYINFLLIDVEGNLWGASNGEVNLFRSARLKGNSLKNVYNSIYFGYSEFLNDVFFVSKDSILDLSDHNLGVFKIPFSFDDLTVDEFGITFFNNSFSIKKIGFKNRRIKIEVDTDSKLLYDNSFIANRIIKLRCNNEHTIVLNNFGLTIISDFGIQHSFREVLDYEIHNNQVYVLTKSNELGFIFEDTIRLLHHFNEDVTKLKYTGGCVGAMSASNIYLFDLSLKLKRTIDCTPLVDHYLQDFLIVNEFCYLKTKEGVINFNYHIQDAFFHTLSSLKVKSLFTQEYGLWTEINSETNFYQNSVSGIDILFQIVSFYDNGKKLIWYNLDDSGWIKVDGLRVVLTGLSHGEHKIRIKLKEEVSEGDIAEFYFVIKTGVFQSWFTYLLIFVFIMILGFYLQHILIKRKRKVVLYKLKSSEWQSKALRSQLNPHFIFNVMNSLQSVLILGSAEKANYFLTKFAKLMRSVLTLSREDFITFNKEKEFLVNYFELEKMRLNIRAELVFNVSFDEKKVHIPPMLFQPFIENSFIHGFKGQSDINRIFFTAILKNEILFVTIEDNGVGIASKGSKDKSHKSVAHEIIDDRLKMLTSYDENALRIEFSDFGTKVFIRIPIKKTP